jgi:hypothetical protein
MTLSKPRAGAWPWEGTGAAMRAVRSAVLMVNAGTTVYPSELAPRLTRIYDEAFRVQTYDIGFAGISNIVFIRWLEDLRLGLMEQTYALMRALAEDAAPILLATRILYRRPVTIASGLDGSILKYRSLRITRRRHPITTLRRSRGQP